MESSSAPQQDEQLIDRQLNPEQTSTATMMQFLQEMERRIAQHRQQLEERLATMQPPISSSMTAPQTIAPQITAPQMIAPQTIEPPLSTPASSSAPLVDNPAPFIFLAKDFSEKIKTSEVPKFDGRKDVEVWIIEFKKYCRLLKLRTDEDILLAASIAMTDEPGYWWESQERNLTTWEQAKKAVLRVYGDRNKQRNSMIKIKNLQQGSKTISAFFTELETLNVYAQLDPETLPIFFEPEFNDDLGMQMELMNILRPIKSYAEWKARALDLGSKLEANKRRYTTTPRTKKVPPTRRPNNNTSNSNNNNKKSKPTQKLVPQEEKDRRMAAGECIKCGRSGHMGKECRTGWKYEPTTSSAELTPSVEVMKGRKRSRGNNQGNRDSKKSFSYTGMYRCTSGHTRRAS